MTRQHWFEVTTHDITIMPGGYILHHSFCWCRLGESR